MPKGRLTPKRQRFVEQYLLDLNATQAAIRAGYSKRTASVQSFDLLRKPAIQEAVQKGREKMTKKTELSREWLLEKLKAVVADVHGQHGRGLCGPRRG